MSNVYIGIDPGLSGGIAILRGRELELHIMPTFGDGKKRRVDVDILDAILFPTRASSSAMILYESPAGSKNARALASMADSFARIETLLILCQFRREPITARKWQKEFWTVPKMAKGKTFDTKAAALKVAKQLWPDRDWRASGRCKVPHDGLVDAALIAEYARRKGL